MTHIEILQHLIKGPLPLKHGGQIELCRFAAGGEWYWVKLVGIAGPFKDLQAYENLVDWNKVTKNEQQQVTDNG